jgi:hypothetical protein
MAALARLDIHPAKRGRDLLLIAVRYTPLQYSAAYVADEEAAHAAGVGIWRGIFEASVGLATRPWQGRCGE